MPDSTHDNVQDASRSPGPEVSVGTILGARYRLDALLGTGASARVYLARDLALDRRVAVKCLRSGLSDDARFLRRFRAEAKAAAQLSHPNLLAVYDWGEGTSGAFLVTEVLLGGSLLDLIERSPRLSPSQGLLIALQVAQGLNYAHGLGWVHRDIKPANLLFGEEGRLRIADFGIARAVAEAAWTEPEGVLVGTARYAAPEQARGGAVDGKADVYSLALTVVEAVTGRVPLVGENALATMVLRQDRSLGEVDDLDELGPLADALEPAGRADPDSRPTAAELIELLTRTARSLPRPERLPLRRHPRVVDPEADGPAEVVAADGDEAARADDPDDDHRLHPGDRVKSRRIPLPHLDRARAPDFAVIDRSSPEGETSGFMALDPSLAALSSSPPPPDWPPPKSPPTEGPPGGDDASLDGPVGGPVDPGAAGDDDGDEGERSREPLTDGPETVIDLTDGPGDDTGDEGERSREPLTDGPETVIDLTDGPGDDTGVEVAAERGAQTSAIESVFEPVVQPAGTAESAGPRPEEPRSLDPSSVPRPGPSRPPATTAAPLDSPLAGRAAPLDPPRHDRPPGFRSPDVGSGGRPRRDDEARPVRLTRVFDDEPVEELASRSGSIAGGGAPGGEQASARAGSPGPPTWSPGRTARRRPQWLALAVLALAIVALITVVAVIAIGSENGGTASSPPTSSSASVGDYVGGTIAAAQVDARLNDWQLSITEGRKDGTDPGEVIQQEPAAGEELMEGGRLSVLVSIGALLREVPDVVGLSVEQATAAIESARLEAGAVTERDDPDAPAGEVLAVMVDGVEPAGELETGTAIDLVISGGPGAEPMPSFVGLTRAAALDQAEALGLVVSEDEAYSERYDAGMVVDTDPATDTPVEPGDELTLVISLGPPLVEIPDVVGLLPEDAIADLRSAGFDVAATFGPDDQPVLATRPAAGEIHRTGTEVTLLTTPP